VPLVLGSTMRLSGLGEGAEGLNDRSPPGRFPYGGGPRGPLGTPTGGVGKAEERIAAPKRESRCALGFWLNHGLLGLGEGRGRAQ
jgi:hypothetical protein